MVAPPEEMDIDSSEKKKAAPSKDVNKKKMIMILLPLLLVVGAAVGIYFSGVADQVFDKDKEGEVVEQEAPADIAVQDINDTIFHELDEMFVNLNTRSRSQGHVLKFRVSLEMEDKGAIRRIDEVMPRVKDTLITHIRELRPEELDGSKGLYRLREELVRRINREISPEEILDVRFLDLQLQ